MRRFSDTNEIWPTLLVREVCIWGNLLFAMQQDWLFWFNVCNGTYQAYLHVYQCMSCMCTDVHASFKSSLRSR